MVRPGLSPLQKQQPVPIAEQRPASYKHFDARASWETPAPAWSRGMFRTGLGRKMDADSRNHQEVNLLLPLTGFGLGDVARRVQWRCSGGLNKSTRWLLDNSAGLSLGSIALVFLAHFCVHDARPHTSKFLSLSYYNPSTGGYAAGYADLCFVAFWVVLLTGVRACLMEYVLIPLARHWGIPKRKAAGRFAEQAWMFIYYSISWPLGMYIYYHSPYFLNMQELWTAWPQREINGPLKAYILGQWAFWLHQVLVINLEERRKDHWQMLIHHFVTIILVASCYAYHHTRIGHLIMISVDVVDLVFPLAKCFNYLGYQTICDTLFGIFAVTWLISRHVLLPVAIWSVYKDSPRLGNTPCFNGTAESLRGPLAAPEGWSHLSAAFQDPAGTVCFTDNVRLGFLACLLTLQVMMFVWSFFIGRVIVRVLRGGNAEDVRSDDEDDDEEEEEQVEEEDEGEDQLAEPQNGSNGASSKDVKSSAVDVSRTSVRQRH